LNDEEYQDMKKILCTVLFGACAAPAFAADVGVSISIGQPGFYGQIDIGSVPQPQLVYPQPVVIRRAPEFVTCRVTSTVAAIMAAVMGMDAVMTRIMAMRKSTATRTNELSLRRGGHLNCLSIVQFERDRP
jgi:hypothetical protein